MNNKHVCLILILLAISFSGCEKNKNPTVTLLNGDFIAGNTNISAGGLLKFKWEASKGKSDLSTFSVLMDGTDLPGFPNKNIPTDVYLDSIYLEGPSVSGNYTFSFQVTDTDGKLGDRGIVITVE
jgi:hypothetical protein